MIWAKWKNEQGVGTPEIIYSGKSVKDANGVTHPANVFDLWTAEELEAIGWYEFVPFTVPNGKEVVSNSYAQNAMKIVEGATTQAKAVTPKPTNAELVDNELSNRKAMLGLVRMIAADKGVTEADVIASIKAQVPDV